MTCRDLGERGCRFSVCVRYKCVALWNLRLKDLLGPVTRVKKKKKPSGCYPPCSQAILGYRRIHHRDYRGTSFIRNRHPAGPYSRTMPRLLWRSYGGGRFLMSEVPLYRSCLSGLGLHPLYQDARGIGRARYLASGVAFSEKTLNEDADRPPCRRARRPRAWRPLSCPRQRQRCFP